MTIPIRERKYARQLISLGCSKDRAVALAALQREVWERQESVEDARQDLRIAIRQAIREEPDFGSGVRALADRKKSVPEAEESA